MIRLLCRRPARALALLAGLALLLGLPACDSNDEDEGRFGVAVRFPDGGGRTLEGRALFAEGDAEEGGNAGGSFRIEGVPRSAQSGFREGLVLARRASSRPAPGRYALAPPTEGALPAEGFAGAIQISFDGGAPTLYYVERGTLVIESFSEGRLRGRLVGVRARRVEAGGTGNAPLSLTVREGDAFFRAEPSEQVRRFPL